MSEGGFGVAGVRTGADRIGGFIGNIEDLIADAVGPADACRISSVVV